jgi:hypothetical protein
MICNDLLRSWKKISGGTCFTPNSMIYYNPKLIFASPFLFFCRFDHTEHPNIGHFMEKRDGNLSDLTNE